MENLKKTKQNKKQTNKFLKNEENLVTSPCDKMSDQSDQETVQHIYKLYN